MMKHWFSKDLITKIMIFFTIEQDEEIIKYIFEEYYKLLDNIENDSN